MRGIHVHCVPLVVLRHANCVDFSFFVHTCCQLQSSHAPGFYLGIKKFGVPVAANPKNIGVHKEIVVTISDGNKLGPITPIFLDWPPSFCYKKHQNAGFPQKTTKNSLAPPSLAHIVHKNFRQRRRKIAKFVNFA